MAYKLKHGIMNYVLHANVNVAVSARIRPRGLKLMYTVCMKINPFRCCLLIDLQRPRQDVPQEIRANWIDTSRDRVTWHRQQHTSKIMY